MLVPYVHRDILGIEEFLQGPEIVVFDCQDSLGGVVNRAKRRLGIVFLDTAAGPRDPLPIVVAGPSYLQLILQQRTIHVGHAPDFPQRLLLHLVQQRRALPLLGLVLPLSIGSRET